MAMKAVYRTVNGRVLSQNKAGVITEFLLDPLGSVIGTSTSAGVVSNRTVYWPYGEVRTGGVSAVTSFGFCGGWGYYTDSSGSLYVRARYYRPAQGRWQTVDPLWPSEMAYGYVRGRVTLFIDPSGFAAVIALVAVPVITVGAVVTVVGVVGSISIGIGIWDYCQQNPDACRPKPIRWPWHPSPPVITISPPVTAPCPPYVGPMPITIAPPAPPSYGDDGDEYYKCVALVHLRCDLILLFSTLPPWEKWMTWISCVEGGIRICRDANPPSVGPPELPPGTPSIGYGGFSTGGGIRYE